LESDSPIDILRARGRKLSLAYESEPNMADKRKPLKKKKLHDKTPDQAVTAKAADDKKQPASK
jgi:hypothetical protein